MGILTNLLTLADQQAQEKRNEERERYAAIAHTEGIQPAIKNWAIDQLVGMAPKKSGIGQLGDLFKGMVGKGGGQSPAAMKSFQEALQSTGAPPQTVQSPVGVASGPQPQASGEPGSLESVLGLQGTQKPGSAPMTVGGVQPSLMLSPQDQLALKLDETRATEKVKRELGNQAEEGLRRIQNEAQLDFERKQATQAEELRSTQALASWNNYQRLKKIYPDEAAKEISGWKDHEQIKGAPKLVRWDDPDLIAYTERKELPVPPPGSQWWKYSDDKGDIVSANRGPDVKEQKPGSGLPGTLGEDAAAHTVIDEYETAKRTGRKSQYTESDYKGAKEFLEKQNRPPAYIFTDREATNEAKDIAQAIRDHRLPPTLTGFGRGGLAGKVATELSKMKDDTGQPFNYAKQQLDWEATRQHIRSLNGAQQTRLQEATTFSISSLNRLSNPDNPGQDIIGQLRRFVPRSQYPILNRAAIKAAKENAFGDAAASAATQLESQIGDLQLELGTVYMGGNSPTDKSLGRAKDMLAGEWSENVLRDGVDLSRANLGYRLNSITQSQPMGVSAENPYATTPTPVPEPPIVNRGAQEALPNPPRKGAKLDAGTARKFLDAFNGDKQQAFNEAKKRGWEP